MKRWSSTHLRIGPMPTKRMMSAPALPTLLYKLPDGPKPKQVEESIANSDSEIRTTRACHWEG